jgi:hypothetical protein
MIHRAKNVGHTAALRLANEVFASFVSFIIPGNNSVKRVLYGIKINRRVEGATGRFATSIKIEAN